MMLYSYTNWSTTIDSYISWLDINLYLLLFFIQNMYIKFINLFFIEFFSLKWASNLVYAWFHPFRLDNLYNFLIADTFAYIWLYKNANPYEYFVWFTYNLYFQNEYNLYNNFINILIIKTTNNIYYFDSYIISIVIKIINYSLFFVFLLNFLFFSRYLINISTLLNNSFVSKFFIFFETEEEVGSVDDALNFIILFFLLFSWFFLVSSLFFNIYLSGFSLLSLGFGILVFFVLLIPLSVLLDFGLAFSSYIRGAGAGTNLIVEIIFDLIGTLVVFTRFIVQNIRFVLIFWAYFELFEWSYLTPYSLILNNIFSVSNTHNTTSVSLVIFNMYYYIVLLISFFIGYIYYFVHLLILLFIQLGAYFLISFWLFFFFYTSFYLSKTEKFFFFKRYLL